MRKEDQFKQLEELLKVLQELGGEAKSERIEITLEDVEFDQEGRVIIKNPEKAEKIKQWLEEGRDVSVGEIGNGGCLNIGFCA
ncbi:MAG: hypothetical protein GXO48_04185 [Chlorobi bacterium]|nr:hypothetical protein [Chlorobiota bacterium]